MPEKEARMGKEKIVRSEERSSSSNPSNHNNNTQQQRTIQRMIGNQEPQAMTPEQTADYLKTTIANSGEGRDVVAAAVTRRRGGELPNVVSSSGPKSSSSSSASGTTMVSAKITAMSGSGKTTTTTTTMTTSTTSTTKTITSSMISSTSGGGGDGDGGGGGSGFVPHSTTQVLSNHTKSGNAQDNNNINSNNQYHRNSRSNSNISSKYYHHQNAATTAPATTTTTTTAALSPLDRSILSGTISASMSAAAAAAAVAAAAALGSCSSTNAMMSGSGSSSKRNNNNNNNNSSSNNNTNNNSNMNNSNDGMPCSEKEMKALMSMFVEIMGLQMNTERLNKVKTHTTNSSNNHNSTYHANQRSTIEASTLTGPSVSNPSNSNDNNSKRPENLFHFPQNLPPPPGGWPEDLLWPMDDPDDQTNLCSSIDEDELDDDDEVYIDELEEEDEDVKWHNAVPALEEIPEDDRRKWIQSSSTPLQLSSASSIPAGHAIAPSHRSSSSSSSRSGNRSYPMGAGGGGWSMNHDPYHHPIDGNNHRFNANCHYVDDYNTEDEVVTGCEGIVPFEWEALERVAVEEALEQEERTRKANRKQQRNSNSNSNNIGSIGTKGGSSNRKKTAEAAKDAALKQAEAAQKKREKNVLSWRTRVANACQSNEANRVEMLLNDSPLHYEGDDPALIMATAAAITGELSPLCATTSSISPMARIRPHLQFLMPVCIPKNRQQVDKNREAREKVLDYILNVAPTITLMPLRNGRSALHTACFYADRDFILKIVGVLANRDVEDDDDDDDDDEYFDDDVDASCQDSGWTPMHYAAMSGSMYAVELLLQHGYHYTVPTSETHTWHANTGKGLTARELLEIVVAGTIKKDMETHGMALQESLDFFCATPTQTIRYLRALHRIAARLRDVEEHGYSPLDDDQLEDVDEGDDEGSVTTTTTAEVHHAPNNHTNKGISSQDSIGSDDVSTKKNRKKKKKCATTGPAAPAPAMEVAGTRGTVQTREASPPAKPAQHDHSKDPLVVALMGMGFTEEQILQGVESCGGIDRATADHVVAWIFGQDGTGGNEELASPTLPVQARTEPESQSGNTTNHAPTSRLRKANLAQQVSTSSSPTNAGRRKQHHQEGSATSNKVLPEAEKKRRESEKKEKEDQLAAERLAAKREEQRRRNREWNKRQLQEAQAKAAKAAEAKRPPLTNGLAPAANYLPPTTSLTGLARNGSTASFTSTLTGPSLAPAALPSRRMTPSYGHPLSVSGMEPLESAFSAETSTIESSLDHVSVEGGNDDATVSTLGSFPPKPITVVQPAMQPASLSSLAPIYLGSNPSGFAPPGFEPSPLASRNFAAPTMATVTTTTATKTSTEWDPQSPIREIRAQAKVFVPANPPPPPPPLSMNVPPGITQPTAMVGHHHHVPMHAPPMPSSAAFGGFSSGAASFGVLPTRSSHQAQLHQQETMSGSAISMSNGPRLLGGSLIQNPGLVGLGGSSIFHASADLRRTDRGGARAVSTGNITMAAPSMLPSSVSGPALPVGLSFGLDPHDTTGVSNESSIIESISTGNTAIRGVPWWGNRSSLSSSQGGTSILNNLLQTSAGSFHHDEEGVVVMDDDHGATPHLNVESFLVGACLSNDDRRTMMDGEEWSRGVGASIAAAPLPSPPHLNTGVPPGVSRGGSIW